MSAALVMAWFARHGYPALDPRLVDALARYVSDLHPGEFALSQPGLQGGVFPTVMRKGEDHWLVRYGGWEPLEFMLSLSPVERPPCPETAIGHDGVTVDTEWGSFKVEECVTRDGGRDLYTYTVTNVSFVCAGCGICEFRVPNLHSFPTLAPGGTATFSTTLNLGAPPPPLPSRGFCGGRLRP